MITVKPREDDSGYANIELHDGRLITWDLTIPEAEKHAQELRLCDHEPKSLHGDRRGGWLCDACGALVEHDGRSQEVADVEVDAALDSWFAEALKGAHDQLRDDVKAKARERMRAALAAAAAAS